MFCKFVQLHYNSFLTFLFKVHTLSYCDLFLIYQFVKTIFTFKFNVTYLHIFTYFVYRMFHVTFRP
jgi:hypothetical protein